MFWKNSSVTPFGPDAFCLGRLLIIDSMSLIDIGLFRWSIPLFLSRKTTQTLRSQPGFIFYLDCFQIISSFTIAFSTFNF